MVSSMTAFARKKCTLDGKPFVIEIRSVNKKALDISVNVPKEFGFIESQMDFPTMSFAEFPSNNFIVA